MPRAVASLSGLRGNTPPPKHVPSKGTLATPRPLRSLLFASQKLLNPIPQTLRSCCPWFLRHAHLCACLPREPNRSRAGWFQTWGCLWCRRMCWDVDRDVHQRQLGSSLVAAGYYSALARAQGRLDCGLDGARLVVNVELPHVWLATRGGGGGLSSVDDLEVNFMEQESARCGGGK